jgi:hypothetical protein
MSYASSSSAAAPEKIRTVTARAVTDAPVHTREIDEHFMSNSSIVVMIGCPEDFSMDRAPCLGGPIIVNRTGISGPSRNNVLHPARMPASKQ